MLVRPLQVPVTDPPNTQPSSPYASATRSPARRVRSVVVWIAL
ncbi:M23 family peptidase, partial [Xanthomonas oryzae pv. oryzae]